MDTQIAVQEYRTHQWTVMIQACRNSGLTVKAWCEEKGINPKSYYYWLRKLRTAALEEQDRSPQFVQISSTESVTCQNKGMILRISGCEMELQEGTSGELIERALRAIRNVW